VESRSTPEALLLPRSIFLELIGASYLYIRVCRGESTQRPFEILIPHRAPVDLSAWAISDLELYRACRDRGAAEAGQG